VTVHDWPLLDGYTQYHPRWFESAAHYEPSEEHRVAFAEEMPADWALERSGIWLLARPARADFPDQGWKLHISVRSGDSVTCLRKALPVLRDEGVSFKFLLDPRTSRASNGKVWPRGSSGKFMAIYPASEAQFLRLGERLAEALKAFSGPYVLSDRRWPGSKCVHYRYGGFRARSRVKIDGSRVLLISAPDGDLVPDFRRPYWDPPPWAVDPLPVTAAGPSPRPSLDGGAFTVSTAVAFSNRGGVYRGRDNRTGKEVILKEARPGVEIGRHGVDAIAALEKEYRLLNQLRDTGSFVHPVKFFLEDEHAFLVEEFLPGDLLGQHTIRYNPIYRRDVTAAGVEDYLRDLYDLWAQLARAIAAAHERNIVLADLSFGNGVVTEGSRLRLLDLECAFEEGVDPQVGLHTPGFANEKTVRTGNSDRANDYYALGAMMYGSLILANGVSTLHPPARGRFLSELEEDLAVPSPLIALIEELMAPTASHEPDGVVEAIQRLPTGTRARTPRLAVPVERRLARSTRSDLRERVAATRAEAASYIAGTADLSREDRLFPADPWVFETNPLSVAYGAAGALYALDRSTGTPPRELLDWFLGYEVTHERYPPGLYVGQAGIAWVLCELGYEEKAKSILRLARSHELLWESHDVLYGASGYGLACLKLWQLGLGEEFLEDAVRVGAHLKSSARIDAQGAHWPGSDGSVRQGYGCGGSGVALFLLYLHCAVGDDDLLELGRSALDFELLHGYRVDGRLAGFPTVLEDGAPPVDDVPRCYWDAGSAGVATTLVRYLALTDDPTLEAHLTEVAADLSHKYTVFPLLFHGLAGMGNALLDIWEYGGEERHLSEAWQVAEGILLFRLERPEGVGFPGEQAVRESADFATGAAGVSLFLDRLIKADEGIHGNFNFVVDELLPGGSLRAARQSRKAPRAQRASTTRT
jgi:serine/threonine protein kinase